MQNLETLILQGFNFIMTLFKIFPKLRELELSRGILENLNGLEGLFHLESLNLSSIRLKEIDNNAFDDLKALVHLDLSEDQLGKIGVDLLENLANLETLSLRENPLNKLEIGSFKYLNKLKNLLLCKCKLVEIDTDTFEGLVSLEKLSLYGNNIIGGGKGFIT